MLMRQLSRFVVLVLVCASLSACGRRGAPELPAEAQELRKEQNAAASAQDPKGSEAKKPSGPLKPKGSFFLDPLL
jgi:predicted small lipoprotein YifL